MKNVPFRISLIKKIQVDQLVIGSYQPNQKQRHNSIFLMINYNLDGICKLFRPDEIINLKIFDLIQLRTELIPIYTLTTNCERERATQADAYIAFRI